MLSRRHRLCRCAATAGGDGTLDSHNTYRHNTLTIDGEGGRFDPEGTFHIDFATAKEEEIATWFTHYKPDSKLQGKLGSRGGLVAAGDRLVLDLDGQTLLKLNAKGDDKPCRFSLDDIEALHPLRFDFVCVKAKVMEQWARLDAGRALQRALKTLDSSDAVAKFTIKTPDKAPLAVQVSICARPIDAQGWAASRCA